MEDVDTLLSAKRRVDSLRLRPFMTAEEDGKA